MPPKRRTTKQVISLCKSVHGELYDYSKVVYKDSKTNINIICRKHGIFSQRLDMHTYGQGCPKCAKEDKAKPRGLKYNTKQIINQFKEVHGDLYDYTGVIYKGSTVKVTIICKEHGEFKQHIAHHKNGHGCSKCAMQIGYFKGRILYYNKPTIVYFLYIKDNIYKVGITTLSVQDRIESLGRPDLNIKAIRTKQFPTGKQAYQYEQKILNKFKAYRYQGKDIISTGNSELIFLST